MGAGSATRQAVTTDELWFGWQNVADLMAEPNIRELILAQYEEFEGFSDKIPLAVDFDRMLEAERHFRFRVWAAKSDGLLIGIIEWHLQTTFHNKSDLYAFDGGHYVLPEFRDNGWTFLKMWRSSLVALQDLAVRVVVAHDNPARPLTPFFKRLGFQPGGSLYMKVLEP